MGRQIDLTAGSVGKTLLSFMLPFFAANFMQALYGVVDMLTVGRFSGTVALSAVNVGAQTMQIIISFTIGCAMGVTVTLGRCVGSRDQSAAERTLRSTTVLFLILAAIITPLMIWQAEHLAVLLQTPPEALPEAARYIRICSMAIPFIVLYNVTAAIFRGLGDSRSPMYVVAIACAVNITGDLLLTGALHLGVTGVAVSTSMAQLISSLCAVVMMRRHRISALPPRPDKALSRNILAVGLPVALQQTLIEICFLILTVIANRRGLVASSAVGVVEKVILLMFLVPSAMLSALSATTAQNIAAGKPERAVRFLRCGILIAAGFGSVMCALSWLFPQGLVSAFATDPAEIRK